MSALASDIVIGTAGGPAQPRRRVLSASLLTLALGLSACAAPHARLARNATAPAAPSAHELQPGEIASLASLTGPELTARLGKPDFQRREPPAELWQYRSAACVLNVFLYPQADGALKVSYVHTQDPRQTRSSADSCSPFAPGGAQVASLR